MSLLMDALRKAEADKKQASGGVASESALTSQETEQAPRSHGEASDPSINAEFGEALETQPTFAGLALEPRDPPERSGNTTTGESMVASARKATTADATAALADPPPIGFTRGRDSNAPEGGLVGTPASAHTVFDAGGGGVSKRVLVWAAIVTVLVALLLGGAGLYYFHQAPQAHRLPSPTVAAAVERPAPKELPVVPVTATPDTGIARTTPNDAPAVEPAPVASVAETATDTTTDNTSTGVAETADGDTSTEPATVAANTAAVPPVTDAPQSERAPSAPPVAASTRAMSPGFDATADAHMPPPMATFLSGEVRVARDVTARRDDVLVQQAYMAYVAGNYDGAETLYTQALQENPRKRDALLGLAAIRLGNGDEADAHTLYRKVLRSDPDNATAQAALFSIEHGAGGDITESRLKLLLERGVDAGYIYFSLGNLYARNTRWADAQQAYFEALRHHPQNADYNYNLAVSLDRIGQRAAALDYYHTALGLADRGHAGFDPAQALARIQALSSESPR